MITRIPPNNPDAEMAVLGGCLHGDKVALSQAVEILSPTDFYKEAHKIIYDAICYLFGNAQIVDMITVADYLTKQGKIDKVGGCYYITELMNRVPSTANIQYHCKIVKDCSVVRQLAVSAELLRDKCLENAEPAADIVADAESQILNIAIKNESGKPEFVRDAVIRCGENIQWYAENPGKIKGLSTGFWTLDQQTNGLEADRNIIIGARPGMGKSAFALTLAVNLAKRGHCGVYFSAEMSKTQLMERAIACESRISIKDLHRSSIIIQRQKDILEAQNILHDIPLLIDDKAAPRIEDIYSKAIRLKIQHNIQFIIIDHIHILATRERGERREQLSRISWLCKAMSKELAIPVIPLAQLNRECEKRKGMDKIPKLADLREDGSIEQDADIILFLFRPEYYGIESYPTDNGNMPTQNLLMVNIAKNRDGEAGAHMNVNLHFAPAIMEIREFDNRPTREDLF